MTVEEYALQTNNNVNFILSKCKSLDIKVKDENDWLDDDAIVMLDNEIGVLPSSNEDLLDEELKDKFELEDRATEIIESIGVDITEEKVQKIKKKAETKDNKKEYFNEKKNIYKNKEKLQSNKNVLEESVILYIDKMTVNDLAEVLNVNAADLVKKLITMGLMISCKETIKFEDAEVLALDYGKTLKKEETTDITNFEEYEIVESENELEKRPVVVTIMGHVDHGKTTLLDYIRNSNVVEGEFGGITQHIAAYQVTQKGNKITFIDTPGHAAFTEMRARGASITDIVVIIVAADDGVMPQTKEAVDHAKAAKVPIIVAINKVDKGIGNIDKIMSEFSEMGLTPEAWGGDTIFVKISALSGEGVDLLLDNIIALSEILNLKANPNKYSRGIVVEARLDKNIGPVVTLLVQNGTLRLGDPIVVGTTFGKVRSLKDDAGKDILNALPSTPVEITGINDVPVAGDKFMAFEGEKEARMVAEKRAVNERQKKFVKKTISLDDLFSHIQEGRKEINILLKADVKGSEEAVKNSLEKINVDGVKIEVIRSGVGAITESDVVLANASSAIIVGFNVIPSSKTKEVAKQYSVDIRLYNIIYKLVEDIELSMKGMLDPEYEEVILGEAEVRKIFKFSKVGSIAGSHVTDGFVKSNSKARLIRDGVVIYDGKIGSLQREKDDVKEVKKGYDCGVTIDSFNDIKEGDIIESYEMKEVKK
jgi:translation initiation factor IF-2